MPKKIFKSAGKFFNNTAETYMYIFLPAVIVGIIVWLKNGKLLEPDRFIILSALVLNFVIMVWLYYKHSYMSLRHTMPILILIAVFIPDGFERIVRLFSGKKTDKKTVVRKMLYIILA